jgi:hypothetical protein
VVRPLGRLVGLKPDLEKNRGNPFDRDRHTLLRKVRDDRFLANSLVSQLFGVVVFGVGDYFLQEKDLW